VSLINDALKRAREANEENRPSTPPLKPLDPVESSSAPASNTPWILVGITTLVALLALFLLYRWSQQPDAGPPMAGVVDPGSPAERDRTISTPPAVDHQIPEPSPAEAGANPTNSASPQSTVSNPKISEANATETAPNSAELVFSPNPESATGEPVLPTDLAAGAPPAPEPEIEPEPEFKLQSVIYRLKNPAVLINGKFLELGETINNAVIIDIQRHTATLRRGATNIDLSLPPI